MTSLLHAEPRVVRSGSDRELVSFRRRAHNGSNDKRSSGVPHYEPSVSRETPSVPQAQPYGDTPIAAAAERASQVLTPGGTGTLPVRHVRGS